MTTTNEIAEKIAAENSLTKTQAKAIVDGVFKAIADAAASGAETSIARCGKFKSRTRLPARVVIRQPAQRSRSRLPRSLPSRQPKPLRTSSTDERSRCTVVP